MTDYGTFLGTGRELWLMLLSLVLGGAMGTVYDLMRIIRMSVRHNGVTVFFEDVLFCLIFGLGWYTFCTDLCGGALRLFVLTGMAVGFGLYIATLGRLVTAIVRVLLSLLGKMSKKISCVLLRLQEFGERRKKSS